MEERVHSAPTPLTQDAETHSGSQKLRSLGRAGPRPGGVAPARVPIVELSDANFGDEVVESRKPVIVEFWAQTCAPCRLLHPIVQRVADLFGERAKFARLNVYENPVTTEALEIKAIPHIMVVSQGDVVLELVGDRSFEELAARLAPFIP